MKRNLNLSALMAVVIISLTACKSEREVSNEAIFKRLSDQEKVQAYADKKQSIVNRLICNQFSEQVYVYTQDIKNKELKKYRSYFEKYPNQFEIVKLFYEPLVGELLKLNGIYDYDASMKNMTAPAIEALPCQGTIAEWTLLQQEYSLIKLNMPSNWFYEESSKYKIEGAIDWVTDLIRKGFYTLLYVAAFVYAFIFHNALVTKRNSVGFFSVGFVFMVVMPILALPFVKDFKNILPFHADIWGAWLISSLLISVVFAVVILLYHRMQRNKHEGIDE